MKHKQVKNERVWFVGDKELTISTEGFNMALYHILNILEKKEKLNIIIYSI